MDLNIVLSLILPRMEKEHSLSSFQLLFAVINLHSQMMHFGYQGLLSIDIRSLVIGDLNFLGECIFFDSCKLVTRVRPIWRWLSRDLTANGTRIKYIVFTFAIENETTWLIVLCWVDINSAHSVRVTNRGSPLVYFIPVHRITKESRHFLKMGLFLLLFINHK